MVSRRTVVHSTAQRPVRSLRVVVLDGADAGREVESEGALGIGSAPGNALELADETVSRCHAALERCADGVRIVDHDSTNGTWVGAARVERAVVAPGTVFTVGRTRVRVEDGAPATVELLESDSLAGLRGRSAVMRELMARIQRAAQSDLSVLVHGETGTGKELVARAVHEASARADGPFELVDCGAQLPTLIASELFGHERGAFTGAERSHVGAFERAHGGTVFMDELGELPAALQPMLLGALERRSFRRVGGAANVDVDVRFVAATNRDLREEVNAGSFRQDLYFRVAVVRLEVPPLRARAEDIPLLVEHFLEQLGCARPVSEVIAPPVMASLQKHSWPGNVRELRNFVEAAYAMGEAPALAPERAAAADAGGPGRLDLPYAEARAEVLDGFERRYLQALMARADHNASEAARLAKMNRGYLNQLLRRHGLR